MAAEPAPYPPERKGERIRRIPFPCARPERVSDPDGNWDRLCKGLPGLRRPADLPDEDRVRWTSWP